MSSSNGIKVLHVTDPHLHADPATELYGVQTDRAFRSVVDRALGDDTWRPDLVLATGDLVEDRSLEGYERFREIMSGHGLPVLCLPGNHDDPNVMSQVLNEKPFSYCAIHDAGDWRLILLSSHVAGDEGGALSEAELERLESGLAEAGNQHVLICVHHQPIDMGSAWLDAYGLRNSAELLSCVNRFDNVRGIVWGHVHQASDRQLNGLRMLSTPSTCAQFTPGTEKCVMDVRPPGFRRLHLNADGGMSTEINWLDDWQVSGRPPDSRQNS